MADEYPMSGNPRGTCVIFNNYEFNAKELCEEVNGWRRNLSVVENIFRHLGFTIEVKNNCSASDIEWRLNEIAKNRDYNKKVDCFACVFLSYAEDEDICASDYGIDMKKLFNIFNGESSPELAGKPKLFIAYASGKAKQNRNVLERDAEGISRHENVSFRRRSVFIPETSNFLYYYFSETLNNATSKAFSESYFLEFLLDEFRRNSRQLDVVEIFTKVNGRFRNIKANSKEDRNGRIPILFSTLSKRLLFYN